MALSILLSDEEVAFLVNCCEAQVRGLTAMGVMRGEVSPEARTYIAVSSSILRKLGAEIPDTGAPLPGGVAAIVRADGAGMPAELPAPKSLPQVLGAFAPNHLQRVAELVYCRLIARTENLRNWTLRETAREAAEISWIAAEEFIREGIRQGSEKASNYD